MLSPDDGQLHGQTTESGSPGESHPGAPTDLGVTVSRHPALLIRSRQYAVTHFHWASKMGARFRSPAHQRWNILWDRSRLYFRQAQRFM